MHLRPRLFNEEGEGQAGSESRGVAWRRHISFSCFTVVALVYEVPHGNPLSNVYVSGKSWRGMHSSKSFSSIAADSFIKKVPGRVLMSVSGAIGANSIRVYLLFWYAFSLCFESK